MAEPCLQSLPFHVYQLVHLLLLSQPPHIEANISLPSRHCITTCRATLRHCHIHIDTLNTPCCYYHIATPLVIFVIFSTQYADTTFFILSLLLHMPLIRCRHYAYAITLILHITYVIISIRCRCQPLTEEGRATRPLLPCNADTAACHCYGHAIVIATHIAATAM